MLTLLVNQNIVFLWSLKDTMVVLMDKEVDGEINLQLISKHTVQELSPRVQNGFVELFAVHIQDI